ncbi:MAG: hypothetical protein GTO18_11085 [Anaerolineales bacterium]|nr:hypothetical protein [Anaerolineales bacterium]
MAILWGLGEFVISMVVFFILGLAGWPGKDDSCVQNRSGGAENACYCERFHPGMIKQPINTWSNLGFVFVGLLILAFLGNEVLGGSAPGNPMATATFYSVGFGAAVIFLGPGSMFFHASMKKWGGWIDNLSMYMFISFFLLYEVVRVLDAGVGLFIVLFLGVNIGLGILTWMVDDSGKWIFGVLVAITLTTEVVFLTTNAGGLEREWMPWLLLALISFGAAFIIWLLSNTGGVLCNPDSWLQGHAVWHLLAAVSTGFLYLYLLTGF